MYKTLIRPVLFKFNPEVAHNLTLNGLKSSQKDPFCAQHRSADI